MFFCYFNFEGTFLNNLLNRTLRNGQVDGNPDSDSTQTVSKIRDVKEVYPLMKEVDCLYQAARWPMECQVRLNSDFFFSKEERKIVLENRMHRISCLPKDSLHRTISITLIKSLHF